MTVNPWRRPRPRNSRRGDAAYSTNPTTAELIGQTDGVTMLQSLKADDEIWVRY
ncbi:hypothetical protein [Vulgatibacter incomptus]|uniref:Uncharacterized protein n=1 Tax=Vulgatibacter incomptus TaxID=1391653 RepID=A0A0K1PGM8_9BACT|nr:hypothetical protein [Vulgatibacter incomptus]AKU92675.1 hypothetical protein AKJ08_3062 [Vulgatibacter incomptus]